MHALDLFQLDDINTMGKSRGATPRINTDVSRLRWHEDEKIRSVEHENDRKNFGVRGWTAVPARKWREFRVLFQQVTMLGEFFQVERWWMEWKVTRKIVCCLICKCAIVCGRGVNAFVEYFLIAEVGK